ncbi:AMP-binding protein [Brevibacillus daliensis]|uniref:AMP-binding protein n=1 Tax=Brevibacillus daliensis TaxID=2892995 RepID=UPI001E548E3D|nr:AMP-binding protein [Brevibacillus daliensis]
MFTINRTDISSYEFECHTQKYMNMEHFLSPERKRYAICVADPLTVISLVLYLRDHDGSVLLIHGETPMETAYQMAVKAECYGLVYQDPKAFRVIEPRRRVEEPSIYQYSSGTTGDAKLVQRSWKEIQAEIDAYNKLFHADAALTPIVLASVTHSYGLICGVLSALARGSKPLIVTHKNPKFAWQVIQDTPEHIVYGLPIFYHILTSFTREHLRFHRIMTSGAPMPEGLFTKLQGMSDVLMQQYGCSEAGCVSVSQQMMSHTDLGKPLSHVTLTAGTNDELPAEIIITSENKQIATQDLGFWTETGRIQFVARMDDVINVSGLKVFPLEVEDVIQKMVGIKEVVVYRGRHPVMGEIVRAQVVTMIGVTPEQIREWCQDLLPGYKVPFEIKCVTSIPKTPTGKISRRLLEMGDISV